MSEAGVSILDFYRKEVREWNDCTLQPGENSPLEVGPIGLDKPFV